MPRYRHAVLGGTFDHFHLGHAALLERAFRVGWQVSVGVTTASFLSAHPKPFPRRIQPYGVRRRAVARWARSHHPGRPVRVVPLADRFGRSSQDGVDVLVVSADTLAGGAAVNTERRRLGRRPVPLEVVPVVLADDLQPVSSRRIRAGEIDQWGRRLSPLAVGIAATNPEDAAILEKAVAKTFPRSRLTQVAVRSRGRARSARAVARELAARAVAGRDLGVGLARGSRASWEVVERTRAVELAPRALPRGSSRSLQRALIRLLSPHVGRKAF